MIDKRKRHFIQLSFLFGALTILILLYKWGYSPPGQTDAEMMSGSMGNMMVSMHGRGATLEDILRQEEALDANRGSHQGQGHHSGSHLSSIHYITTMAVIVLLPLIIAGSVFLAIVWLK